MYSSIYFTTLLLLLSLPTINCISKDSPNYIKSLSDLHQYTSKSLNPPRTKPCDKWSEFQCLSQFHGIQCIPNGQRCDGEYQCKDQSDERHCFLNYNKKDFAAKCHNGHGSYAPYALSDIFDKNILNAGEISVAPKDYLECNIQFKNVTNLDMVKFTFEGVGSYAQMISENILMRIYYLQANAWIPINSTYYDRDSTQLTTTFITEKNERGIYTNNIKFKLYNIAPKKNKNYKFVKNEFLHIIGVRIYGNYMPFYCPTNLVKKFSMFEKQIAEWKYIQTYKICDSKPDCLDGSDEIFCSHDGLQNRNTKVSLGKLLNNHKHGMKKSNAPKTYNSLTVIAIISIYCLFNSLM